MTTGGVHLFLAPSGDWYDGAFVLAFGAPMESVSIQSIICPACHAELPVDAEVCGQCGVSTRSSDGAEVERRLRDRPWVMAILLLHLGAFGIPLYWRAHYTRKTRITLVALSIVYTIFVFVVVAWGIWQIMRLLQAF